MIAKFTNYGTCGEEPLFMEKEKPKITRNSEDARIKYIGRDKRLANI